MPEDRPDVIVYDVPKKAGYTRAAKPSGLKRLFYGLDLRHYDFALLFFSASLTVMGIAAIGSAEPDLFNRQILGMAIALLAMFFVSVFDYRWVLKWYIPAYILTIVLLVAVLVNGSAGGGATRWIEFGSFRFQPSEAAKIMLILFFSQFIMKNKDGAKKLWFDLICVLLVLPVLYLIFREPDLSTTIVVFLIFCTMMFIGGVSWKLILAILILVVPTSVILFSAVLREGQTLINDFQRLRILAWLHPEDYPDQAYQTLNSIMAIGSGQLTGKGYNTNSIGSLLNSGYISESQTDFIFTVIGEEFGFIGTSVTVALIFLIALRCFMIARRAPDIGGTILASAVGSWVAFQGFMNIGVATGVLPNTGIPLPFVSYGLTSLVSLFLGIGFVMNVRMQSFAPREM